MTALEELKDKLERGEIMAYDIFGNVLRRGYCEVHPDIQEEYPCSLCYEELESEQIEREHAKWEGQQIDSYHSQQYEEYIKELMENENKQLKETKQ